MVKSKLAIFASGKGSNALNLMDHFKSHPHIQIEFVLCNKADAPIVELAAQKGVKVIICSNEQVEMPDYLAQLCKNRKIDHLVLAGFLRKIPSDLVAAYPNKIINIHPSLLPKYGGTGMYGKFVHEAVLANREKQTGISIHLVNEEYDRGEILAQFTCELNEEDNLESVQKKIHQLEMKHFPLIVEQTLLKTNKTSND